jgi:acyl dehydratase
MTSPRPIGKYFEEFETGEAIESPGRTVTIDDIESFVRLTGDNNRLHTDDEFARESGFTGRIAHGALVVSLAIGQAWKLGILKDTTLAFRAIDEWKFVAPVYPGDTIQLRGKIGETRAMPRLKAGLVRFELDVVNQSGVVTCTGALRMLMRMRPTS